MVDTYDRKPAEHCSRGPGLDPRQFNKFDVIFEFHFMINHNHHRP